MTRLYRCLSLATALLLMFTSVALAQERVVSGTVTDENGGAMPGVNVIVKGTAIGTATDVSGKFSLSVPNDQSTLVISFVGYASTEVVVGSKTSIDVQLTPDVTTLSELVITGYTEQRRRDITGAVTIVDAEALKTVKAANLGQQLAGRAPGVTVATSGAPGEGANIRIRGINSFTNSDPLIIIDGVQIQGDKALLGLNPNDIESMQVLKDAASAAVYGARANNGVIIITTKQGRAGKVSVTYSGYVGTQTPVGGYNDFLHNDPLEYAQKWHTVKNPSTGFDEDAGTSVGTFYGGLGSAATLPVLFYHPDGNTNESTYNFPLDPTQEPTLFMRSNTQGTDWWDEVFDPATITNHNIGISGGSDIGTFAASVDYFKQNGTMKYTGLERFTGRVNSTMKTGKFTLGEALTFARTSWVNQQGGNQQEGNVMTNILKMNSIVPVYDIKGNFASARTVGFSNGSNPLAMAWRNRNDESINYRLMGNIFAEFAITDYLKAKTSFSPGFAQDFWQNFQFPTWEDREFNGSNNYSENHQTGFGWVWTNSLQFNKVLAEKHNITAFVGYEALKNSARQISGQLNGYRFLSTDVRYLNLALAEFNTVNSRQERDQRIASIFAKVDYNLSDKYLVSVSVRRDGSSNFAASQRYGTFPAFSLGWRISEEAFLQGTNWLDDLKIRFGWGITGNQIIPVAYNAFDRWGAQNTHDASYDIGGTNEGNVAGYTRTNIGNPLTGWEENKQMNVGFDATLMNGKLGLVFDVYSKDVTNLLFNAPLTGQNGNAIVPYSNVGNMTNNGWDASINYRDNISSDLSFNIGLNLSHYKNEIKSLDGFATSIFPGGIDKRFGEVNAWKIGHPISGFYGFTQDGIFQNAADLAALDQPGEAIGRFRWKDLNSDGVINDDDKGVIGSPHPDLTMGLNIGLNYKRIDFTMFMFGSFGNDIYNYNKLFTHFGFFNSNVSQEAIDEAWTSEGKGSLPKIDGGDSFSTESSTFYVENGGYLRAQTISLGYTLPKTKVFQSVRLYVQAQNLFTITKYEGIDPALSSVNVGNSQTQNDGWAGFDFGNYPSSKVFMVGINASF